MLNPYENHSQGYSVRVQGLGESYPKDLGRFDNKLAAVINRESNKWAEPNKTWLFLAGAR